MEDVSKGVAHLNDLGLFLEIRVQVFVALVRLMVGIYSHSEQRKPPERLCPTWDLGNRQRQ